MNPENIVATIEYQGMLPLFYTDSESITIKIAESLYSAGIKVIEYTNRGKNAYRNFIALKTIRDQSMPDLIIGIGTIKTKEEAIEYINAGVNFIVCPIVNEDVAKLCNERNILWIPGCMTPTEINLAQNYRAKLIKIFPANILGPDFLMSIKDLFRNQKFMPTGGVFIEQDNFNKWFDAGVIALGIGSQLINNEIILEEKYDLLISKTKLAFDLIYTYRDQNNIQYES